MSRARKIDANQPSIVKFFRGLGYSVAITSGAGDGFPDLVIGKGGQNWLIEIKDGDKPKSQQKLTEKQVKFHGEWRGQISVINSVEAAERWHFHANLPPICIARD